MSELHQTLQGLHEELRRAERLDPDDRAVLESLLGDIRRLLETTPPAPVTKKAGEATPHGDALEGAAVRLEAGHPGVAGAIRAVLDALGKAGI
ncbi:MAG: DUF4404 family protein [Steroidobacteraceae bacterium]|nr:DUF4404 family protein [Steroidobacteraceae bacterium]